MNIRVFFPGYPPFATHPSVVRADGYAYFGPRIFIFLFLGKVCEKVAGK